MFTADQTERIADSNAATHNEGTDLFLPNEVEQALRSTGYQGLCSVEVSVHCGVVFLKGYVSSFHLKQIAQTAARTVPGVCEVRNELNVGCPR